MNEEQKEAIKAQSSVIVAVGLMGAFSSMQAQMKRGDAPDAETMNAFVDTLSSTVAMYAIGLAEEKYKEGWDDAMALTLGDKGREFSAMMEKDNG